MELFPWFGCWNLIRLSRATEPGFAGDIGDIEICLIDWLIEMSSMRSLEQQQRNDKEGAC